MSMTREKAITQLEILLEYCESMMTGCEPVWRRDCEALQMSIAALRPVSREQVENVWRGEWNNINPVVLKPGVPWVCRCAKCGCPQDYRHNFCPNCGEAKTDGAVEMVMGRMEALHETT